MRLWLGSATLQAASSGAIPTLSSATWPNGTAPEFEALPTRSAMSDDNSEMR